MIIVSFVVMLWFWSIALLWACLGCWGGWVGPNDDLYLEEKLKKSRSVEEELSLVGDYIIWLFTI